MNLNKKVSIAMCTYNGEKYIREQLDSIVNQTYPIDEVIIQDDHSKDGTIQILLEYAERYP
ncbi:MAG: glycosyltransferase, partial [Parabacteroides sp.]|nr:glycosyltransferase [Parabacteroides sp.]